MRSPKFHVVIAGLIALLWLHGICLAMQPMGANDSQGRPEELTGDCRTVATPLLIASRESLDGKAMVQKGFDTLGDQENALLKAARRDINSMAFALEIEQWALNISTDYEEIKCPELAGLKTISEYVDLLMNYRKRDDCSKSIAAAYFTNNKTDYALNGVEMNTPELALLIINSQIMGVEEKQYWIDILPQMSQEQIGRLDDILQVEYFKEKIL